MTFLNFMWVSSWQILPQLNGKGLVKCCQAQGPDLSGNLKLSNKQDLKVAKGKRFDSRGTFVTRAIFHSNQIDLVSSINFSKIILWLNLTLTKVRFLDLTSGWESQESVNFQWRTPGKIFTWGYCLHSQECTLFYNHYHLFAWMPTRKIIYFT